MGSILGGGGTTWKRGDPNRSAAPTMPAPTYSNPATGLPPTSGGGGGYSGGGLGGGGGSAPVYTPPPMPPMPNWPSAPTPAAPAAPTPPPPPMPVQQQQIPWKPQAPQASQISQTMAGYGEGLIDPNSQLSRQMQETLTGRIGEETGAAKRLAAFQASQAGMGGGQSPELMAMMGDIDIAGMETGGRASGEMMTQLPGMGLGFLQGGLQGELGISGQALQGWLTQQQMNQQAQQQNVQSYYQGQNVDLERERMAMERERMNQEAMMNQFGMMFNT